MVIRWIRILGHDIRTCVNAIQNPRYRRNFVAVAIKKLMGGTLMHIQSVVRGGELTLL